MISLDLSGKCAFVTGGGRGIGKAISIALAAAGADVALSYKEDSGSAIDVAESIKKSGRNVVTLKMEVTQRNNVREAIENAEKALGRIDILINNAGINSPCDFDQITDDKWDEVMAVNLKGPFICGQEILPVFKRQGQGNIINISSVSGQYGGPRTAHYAASKAGLISLGQVIARFGAQYNIRCNTLAVGLVESKMAQQGMQSKIVNQMTNSILLKRLGTQDEVAQAVVFLASDASSYITAQTININGGLYF